MHKKYTLIDYELKAIKNFKEIVSSKFNLLDLRLFGSKARGDHTPESDIDIMIILSDLNPSIEEEIDDIIFNINIKYDVFISIMALLQKVTYKKDYFYKTHILQ